MGGRIGGGLVGPTCPEISRGVPLHCVRCAQVRQPLPDSYPGKTTDSMQHASAATACEIKHFVRRLWLLDSMLAQALDLTALTARRRCLGALNLGSCAPNGAPSTIPVPSRKNEKIPGSSLTDTALSKESNLAANASTWMDPQSLPQRLCAGLGGLAQGLGGWLCWPVTARIGLSPLNLLL